MTLNPTPEEVKLVHEAVRALNNFIHTPQLRDTDLSTELSQHLFDIQLACHQQKYPVNVLPNDIVYEPPALPNYIPSELKSVTGPPSNEEIASVHAALRISESFANVPSIFDSEVHIQLSQHLFDIQFAQHVQRSITQKFTPATTVHRGQLADHGSPKEASADSHPGPHIALNAAYQGVTETTEMTHDLPNPPEEVTGHQNSSISGELCNIKDLMTEMRDTMKNIKSILVRSQNSLARGFNSSSPHGKDGYDLGAHSLINDSGELPEAHDLPTFKHISNGYYTYVSFSIKDLTEDVLVRYLRFYNIGKEMIEEGEELKIKTGMIDDAKNLLSRRIYQNQQ